MRPTRLLLAALATATVQAQQLAPGIEPAGSRPGVLRDSDWFERVTGALQSAEYEFSAPTDSCVAWTAPNRGQALRSALTPDGLEVVERTPRPDDGAGWRLTLRTERFGRDGDAATLEPAALRACGDRVQLDHGPLTEWFENRPEGVEQGWTIEARPEGHGPLAIELALGGGFALQLDGDARGGVLVRDDVELPYRGLVAFDADGHRLEAWLEASASGLRVLVDDADALYPVTVDPVLQGPSWLVESNQYQARLGFAVAMIGDVNGDGFDDVAVGAPGYDGGQSDEGRVWVFHGSSSGLPTGSSWFDESNQAGAEYGRAIAGAGDVNGDGYDDLLIAAPLFDGGQTDEGAVFGYHGSPSGLPSSTSWYADGDQVGAEFGTSVASAGDVNGDGYDEALVGAPKFDQGHTDEGKAWVFHGGASGLETIAGWSKVSGQTSAELGEAVAGAGDVDGDGFDDILVAAPRFDGPEVNEGRVWRFDGSASGLPAGSSWSYEANQVGAGFGSAVASAGDVNGDGFADILVGAPYFDAPSPNEGRAYLYHGGVLNSSTPSWIREGNSTGVQFGFAVAGVGDTNGDGFDDVIVGAPEFNLPHADAGRVQMFLGSPVGAMLNPLWGDSGDQSGAHFGHAVAGGGDVDGDGFADVVVGAPQRDNGQIDEGRVYLYTGSPELGTPFCAATVNSTGSPAQIQALYSPSISAGNLRLEAGPVPNGFGLFIHAPMGGQVALGDGYLCVSGPFVRGPVVTATNNMATFTYDNSTIHHTLNGYAGTTRYFQAWFRDAAVGGSGFNLSNAVSLQIFE